MTFSADGSRATLLMRLQGPPFYRTPTVGIVVDTKIPRLLLPLISLRQGGYGPSALAISPAGDRLAVGDDAGWVELRGLTDGRVQRIPGATEVNAIGWSRDGRKVVIGHLDGSLGVYTTDPVQEIARYAGLGNMVMVAALRNDLVISRDEPGSITTRSLSGTNGFTKVITSGRGQSVAAGPPGTVVAVGEEDGKVARFAQSTLARVPGDLWLGPYPEKDTTADPRLHRRVSALAITPDGSALVAADRVGHLRMWSLPSGQLLWSRDDVPSSFLAISPDGKYLATSGFTQDPADPHPDSTPVSTRIVVWNLATKRPVLTALLPKRADSGNPPKPRAVAFSPYSRLVAAGFFEEGVEVYDLSNGHHRTIPSETSSLVFSPDGRELLVRDFAGTITGYALNHRPVPSTPSPPQPLATAIWRSRRTVSGWWGAMASRWMSGTHTVAESLSRGCSCPRTAPTMLWRSPAPATTGCSSRPRPAWSPST